MPDIYIVFLCRLAIPYDQIVDRSKGLCQLSIRFGRIFMIFLFMETSTHTPQATAVEPVKIQENNRSCRQALSLEKHKKLLKDCFHDTLTPTNILHNHIICTEKGCTQLSETTQM